MLVDWKGVRIALLVLLAVLAFCALDLNCSGSKDENATLSRVRSELAVGRREARLKQADDLARVALDMRVLAKRHAANGRTKEAQQCIAAALELDSEIKRLRGAKQGD